MVYDRIEYNKEIITSQEADLVVKLPGQPEVNFRHYSLTSGTIPAMLPLMRTMGGHSSIGSSKPLIMLTRDLFFFGSTEVYYLNLIQPKI